MDVFATRLRDGEPAGTRTHLFRVEAGEILVGGPEVAGMTMIAAGAPGTSATEFVLSSLHGVDDPPEIKAPATALIDAWVGHVYDGLGIDHRIPRHRTLDTGGEVAVGAGVCVRPEPAVGWFRQVTGTAHLTGHPAAAIPSGALLPVTQQAWVRTAECSTVRLLTTAELLASEGAGAAWRALGQLHAIALALVVERVRRAENAHGERVRRQHRAKQVAMSGVISRLAATMEPHAAKHPLVRLRPKEENESKDASLYPAFRLVTAAQGIEVSAARRNHEQALPKDPINGLARASRLRARRVSLRPGWWRQDGDPLLARLAERKRAVALLPVPGGFDLVDPYERRQTRVDANVAATLSPFAYTFYRPFGPEALRAGALLRFGLRGCRRDVLSVVAAGGAMALLGLVTPLVIGMLYNTVIPGADRGQLLQLTLGLLAATAATAVFQVVRGIALLRIESKAGPRLQAAVWDRLLTLPLPFFRDYTAGDLAMRAMGIEEIRTIASTTAVTVLLSGVFSLANFALLFHYDGRLAWIAAALIAVAVAASLVIGYLQLRSQREALRVRSKVAGVVLQLLTGIPKLKTSGAEVHGFGLWARLFSEQRQQQFRARTLRNVQSVINAAFPVVSMLALFAAAAPVTDGAAPDGAGLPMATGDFVAFLSAFAGALAAMLSSSAALIATLAIVPLYEQLKPILQTMPEVHAGKHDPGELSGGIELQHITFRYRPDGPTVLHDVSVRVRPGEFVALAGPSGSGKSTTLRLLLGFEVPESGIVTYDEQDLSGLDLEAARRQIGVVMQSGRVMSGDIYTNIVGSSNATLEDAWDAARMAGLDEDIKQMPMGMHTVISDGGGTLSGGQRQRLMIARALVRRPRILFFDEATSALDNRTQEIVSRSLDRLKATRIVVAHRLSTIRNADRIYVIQAGSVVEAGTYDDLLARGGVFAQLATRQLV